MDIATQTALCQMSAPLGVGPDDPFPCALRWVGDGGKDLLIGWADSFRQVRISEGAVAAATGAAPGGPEDGKGSGRSQSRGASRSMSTAAAPSPSARAGATGVDGGGGGDGAAVKVATIVAEWMTDSIICGIHSFDADHVVFLAYTPPQDDEEEEEEEQEEYVETDGDGSYAGRADGGGMKRRQVSDDEGTLKSHSSNQPEVIVAKRTTGEIVSADILPLRGYNMNGPDRYTLLSSYQCRRNRDDANKWTLRNYRTQRGGARGYAPIYFIASPMDFVAARVRDVDDRWAPANKIFCNCC
jgi:hypothetical protein